MVRKINESGESYGRNKKNNGCANAKGVNVSLMPCHFVNYTDAAGSPARKYSRRIIILTIAIKVFVPLAGKCCESHLIKSTLII